MASVSYRDQVGAIGTLSGRKTSISNRTYSALGQRAWDNRPQRGTGTLSSSFPSALTTVEGIPVSAQVLVRYRAATPGDPMDGVLVAQTTSTAAGEWQINDLDSSLRYDVSARYAGENDALQSDVAPFDEARFVPSTLPVAVGVPLDVPLPVVGGTGAVSVVYVSGTYPIGVSLVGDRLQGAWPTGATGSYPVTFDLTDDEGTFTHILNIELYLLPMKLVGSVPALIVGDPISTVFTASGGEGPYTYSVSAGSLPAGLSLNSSTGALTGTPATPGAYSFDITATDVRSATASKTYSGAVFGAHKYWRIRVSSNNGYAYANLVELMFDGVRATGGTPVYSTQYDSGAWAADKAFDGVVTGDTGWSSAVNDVVGAYIGYEFATPRAVGSITIVAGTSSGGLTGMPRDFDVQSSDDGVTWTDEWSVSGQTGWTANEQRTFPRP